MLNHTTIKYSNPDKSNKKKNQIHLLVYKFNVIDSHTVVLEILPFERFQYGVLVDLRVNQDFFRILVISIRIFCTSGFCSGIQFQSSHVLFSTSKSLYICSCFAHLNSRKVRGSTRHSKIALNLLV
jgi:hypothetical protein